MSEERKVEQRVDFALMLTHLYGALNELKCSAFTIPTTIVGVDTACDLTDIKNALYEFTEKMHTKYKELYYQEGEK